MILGFYFSEIGLMKKLNGIKSFFYLVSRFLHAGLFSMKFNKRENVDKLRQIKILFPCAEKNIYEITNNFLAYKFVYYSNTRYLKYQFTKCAQFYVHVCINIYYWENICC